MQFVTKIIKQMALAFRMWLLTSAVFAIGCFVFSLVNSDFIEVWWLCIPAGFAAAVSSAPVLLAFIIGIPFIQRTLTLRTDKINRLVLLCFICIIPYGLIGGAVFANNYNNDNYWTDYFLYSLATFVVLFSCALLSMQLSRKSILEYFTNDILTINSITQINHQMETEQLPAAYHQAKPQSNKIFIKGLITGGLILIMMIPTLFVSNLVTERQKRQEEVVKEVSSKWASDQTLAGPYIFLPYTINEIDKDKRVTVIEKHLLLLPENLDIKGEVSPEIRPRSIYKVLLYRSSMKTSGNFKIHLPKGVDPATINFADARICFGITDFKGIEEKLAVQFNGNAYELSPGVPVNDIDEHGLSAPINLSTADFEKELAFAMDVKIKGSEQLHFVPLSGNSSVSVKSTWASPSFDGNNLPSERKVDDSGFTAKWVVNKANLPFGTVLQGNDFKKDAYAFGVSLVQPADQYAKTMRSVKYAILFIGLTFSLFFIVELMQKKPFHPVQYVLVGLALVIFYTLLLSFSEFIVFDQAYLVAAAATISLITLYAKGHFKTWAIAGLFAAVLSGLYGFIFILIRLEDTALLVGSIGLFLVLALVMYGSRKINWYNTTTTDDELATA